MSSFEDTLAEFENDAPDGEPPPKLTAYEFHIASHFWDASRTQALFEANAAAGDSANEAEKDARRKVAVDCILHECDSFGPCLPREKLDAIIKECQG